jgi:quinol monooxygenase YgiN
MVKIIYRVVVKENHVDEFKALADQVLIPEAKKLPGCHLFSLFQNGTNSAEFIFYELWGNEEDVQEYKKELITILGKNRAGEELPAKLNDLFIEDEDLI